MIRLEIMNDGTGNGGCGNYVVSLHLSREPARHVRVEGFDRRLGWEALVTLALRELMMVEVDG